MRAVKTLEEIVQLGSLDSLADFPSVRVQEASLDIKLASRMSQFYCLPLDIKKNLDVIKMSSLRMKVDVVLDLLYQDLGEESY